MGHIQLCIRLNTWGTTAASDTQIWVKQQLFFLLFNFHFNWIISLNSASWLAESISWHECVFVCLFVSPGIGCHSWRGDNQASLRHPMFHHNSMLAGRQRAPRPHYLTVWDGGAPPPHSLSTASTRHRRHTTDSHSLHLHRWTGLFENIIYMSFWIVSTNASNWLNPSTGPYTGCFF